MASIKTPGVWTQEVSTLPPSIAEVDTAVPAFIGYTETAIRLTTGDLLKVPFKIYSLKEFEYHYGLPPPTQITVQVQENTDAPLEVTPYRISRVDFTVPPFILYQSVRLYFENGGGECYIVSVGTYGTAATSAPAQSGNNKKAPKTTGTTPTDTTATATGAPPTGTPTATPVAPTAPVVISAVSDADLLAGIEALELEDEPTLIVIPEAVKLGANQYATVVQAAIKQCATLKDRLAIIDVYDGAKKDINLSTNRGYFGNNNLSYAAAYFPFLRTAINHYANDADIKVDFNGAVNTLADLKNPTTTNTGVYNAVKLELKSYYVDLPPSGAVAGVYAATDKDRGVWKAPANVSLTDVVEPVVRIDGERQDAYNVDPETGKSINVIKSFSGKGTLVWGARTLAGNDNEWRYVSVRRLFLMLEESIKKSTYWAVFEANNAQTWVKVRGMIENYLTQKWREGALAGATTKDAFYVRCGLGTTMDVDDILEGRMVVEIGVAAVRPAEFIIIRFSHKLQTS